MPRYATDTPVGEDDRLDAIESRMLLHLLEARIQFELAGEIVREAGDPEDQMDVFGRFNATMRRLMKGGDEEWLKPDKKRKNV